MRETLRRLDIPDREGPFRDVYRALPYVRREIESLAEQLRAIAAARMTIEDLKAIAQKALSTMALSASAMTAS